MEELTAVVGKSREGRNRSRLLSTTWACTRDEDTCELARETTACPQASRGVPEGLPLGWEVAVTGGDAEEEGVVGSEGSGIDDGVIRLGGSVHLRCVRASRHRWPSKAGRQERSVCE